MSGPRTALPLVAFRYRETPVSAELLEANHTFGISHPMVEPSVALGRAVALTVDFYAAHLR